MIFSQQSPREHHNGLRSAASGVQDVGRSREHVLANGQTWAGRIGSIRTEGRQRRFDVDGRRGRAAVVSRTREARSGTKDDLARQIAHMRRKWPTAEVVQDIGSGFNFKRKGLRSLLERAMRGEKLEVVVTHRDRLARFGFEIIEFVVARAGGSIVVLNKVSLSPEAERSADLYAIVHIFSCRINGHRS